MTVRVGLVHSVIPAIRAVEDRGDVATLYRIFRLLQTPFDELPEEEDFAAPPPAARCGLEVSCSS